MPRCRDEDSGVIEHFMCTRTERALAKVASFEKYRAASIFDVKRWQNIFSQAARSRAYVERLGNSFLSCQKRHVPIYIYIYVYIYICIYLKHFQATCILYNFLLS